MNKNGFIEAIKKETGRPHLVISKKCDVLHLWYQEIAPKSDLCVTIITSILIQIGPVTSYSQPSLNWVLGKLESLGMLKK